MGKDERIVVTVPDALWPFTEDEIPAHLRTRFERRKWGSQGATQRGAFLPDEARLLRMALLRTERHLLTQYGKREIQLATRCAGIADRIEADLRVAGHPA